MIGAILLTAAIVAFLVIFDWNWFRGPVGRLASARLNREVVIGFDRPFVMIGERINPTGRKLLAEEMKKLPVPKMVYKSATVSGNEANVKITVTAESSGEPVTLPLVDGAGTVQDQKRDLKAPATN